MAKLNFSADTRGPELLKQMVAELKTAVDHLVQMLGVATNEHEQLNTVIAGAEAESTDLFYGLLTHMRSAFVTVLPREDLYRIARSLYECTESVAATADMVRMTSAQQLPRQATETLEILTQQVDLAAAAMGRLQELNFLEDFWLQMLRLCKRADRSHRMWIAELSGQYKPNTYIRQWDVANYLAAANKSMHALATHLGVVLVKES